VCKDSKRAPPSLPRTGFVWASTAMGPRALHDLHTLLLRHWLREAEVGGFPSVPEANSECDRQSRSYTTSSSLYGYSMCEEATQAHRCHFCWLITASLRRHEPSSHREYSAVATSVCTIDMAYCVQGGPGIKPLLRIIKSRLHEHHLTLRDT